MLLIVFQEHEEILETLRAMKAGKRKRVLENVFEKTKKFRLNDKEDKTDLEEIAKDNFENADADEILAKEEMEILQFEKELELDQIKKVEKVKEIATEALLTTTPTPFHQPSNPFLRKVTKQGLGGYEPVLQAPKGLDESWAPKGLDDLFSALDDTFS